MRRVGIVAVLSLALLAVIAPTASAAPWWRTPTFVARAGQAAPTETLRIGARALHISPWARVSASAVVHFASGDVAVQLQPRGWRWWHFFGGSVTVPTCEAAGSVAVDVTFTYRGALYPASATATVVAPETPDPTCGETHPIQS